MQYSSVVEAGDEGHEERRQIKGLLCEADAFDYGIWISFARLTDGNAGTEYRETASLTGDGKEGRGKRGHKHSNAVGYGVLIRKLEGAARGLKGS